MKIKMRPLHFLSVRLARTKHAVKSPSEEFAARCSPSLLAYGETVPARAVQRLFSNKSNLTCFIIFAGAFLLISFIYILKPVEAHMPGAKPPPEFKLKPIVLNDNGAKIKITIEDVAEYHNQKTKQIRKKILAAEGKSAAEIDKVIKEEFSGADGKCSCVSCAFRATLLGIQKLWGREIPKRSDIKIISYLPSPGSMQCFEYITGSGLGMSNVRSKGEFVLVRLPGKRAVDIGIDDWKFEVIRKSTGDRFEIRARKNVYPEDFFELRKKVTIEESATEQETKEYSVMWQEVRDAFLTKADWELFEGIEEPFPIGGVVFFSLLIIAAGSLLYVHKRKK